MKFRKLTLLLVTAMLALGCVACRTIPTRPGDPIAPRVNTPSNNNNMVPNRDTTPNTNRTTNRTTNRATDRTTNGTTNRSTNSNPDGTINRTTIPNSGTIPSTGSTNQM